MSTSTDAPTRKVDGKSVRAIDSLLTDMNHEIRTLMSGIAGMLELLLDTELTPSQQQFATTARHNAAELMPLIEDIVDFSMITANRLELAQIPINLLSEMQAAYAAPWVAAQAKGLTLHGQFPPSTSLRGDPARLRQMIACLLNGAVRLIADGTINVATDAAHGSDGLCRIRMTITIPEPDPTSRQLLSKLNQAREAGFITLQTHSRIGLELALCGQLAALMSAQIGVKHRLGQTSIVRIATELPCSPVPSQGTTAQTSACAPADGERVQTFTGRVLVADDNPINQQVAQYMVEKFGCHADVASDGAEAVALHAAHPYDLILMDCQMPQLDGYQATQRIRVLEGSVRHTPVIALTACATQSERENCLANGMDDFITKPVQPQALEEVLGRWLAHVPTKHDSAAPPCTDKLDAVREMFGADFAELTKLYQRDSSPRIAALYSAAAAGDHLQVAKVAHAFAGSSASIGATSLSALCRELELRAKADTPDDFMHRLAAIKTEYGRISDRLQSMQQLSRSTEVR